MPKETASDEYYARDTPSQKNTPSQISLPSKADAPAPPKTSTGLHSEHGHSLTRIQPMSKHSGESVSTFFNGLFTTIIGISTLGASITFSYVLSNNTPPAPGHHVFSADNIQLFLSISWLLFLLALAFASLGSTLLTFFKKHWIDDWDGKHGKTSQTSVQLYATCASGLMGGLVIAAFFFLCLVVIGYSPAIGWIALGFTTAFGLLILIACLYQTPWSWRNASQPKRATTAREDTIHVNMEVGV